MELFIPVIFIGGTAICTATNPYSTVNISANITVISEWGDFLLSVNGIIIVSENYTFMLDAGAKTSSASRIAVGFQFTVTLNNTDMLLILSGEVRNVLNITRPRLIN